MRILIARLAPFPVRAELVEAQCATGEHVCVARALRQAQGERGWVARLLLLLLTALAALTLAAPASADRIKDLGGFQGIRSNQMSG